MSKNQCEACRWWGAERAHDRDRPYGTCHREPAGAGPSGRASYHDPNDPSAPGPIITRECGIGQLSMTGALASLEEREVTDRREIPNKRPAGAVRLRRQLEDPLYRGPGVAGLRLDALRRRPRGGLPEL